MVKNWSGIGPKSLHIGASEQLTARYPDVSDTTCEAAFRTLRRGRQEVVSGPRIETQRVPQRVARAELVADRAQGQATGRRSSSLASERVQCPRASLGRLHGVSSS